MEWTKMNSAEIESKNRFFFDSKMDYEFFIEGNRDNFYAGYYVYDELLLEHIVKWKYFHSGVKYVSFDSDPNIKAYCVGFYQSKNHPLPYPVFKVLAIFK